jgi:Phosphodiester glycosidase
LSKVGILILSAAALLVAGIGTAVGAGTLPAGYSVADRETVYPGVDYQKIVKPAAPVLAHVAHIAPGAAVDLRVVDAHDKIPNRPTDLETTSSMCRRVGCVMAVNGDFHNFGQPVGGVITGGRMLRSPDPGRAQIWLDDAGRLAAAPFPWSAALRLSDGSQVAITGVNVRGGGGPVLYTPAWGTTTPPSGGIELVMAASAPLAPLNRPVPVTLQGVRVSPGGIPAGGAVIAVPAGAADQLNGVWARVQRGTVSPQADVIVQSPVNAVESIGTNPVVLHDGQPALPWPNDANVVAAVQPRTLVGWNSAGDVFFVVVDGRQASSAGLTMAQAADMLAGLGATEGVNLDGGGGSTLVVGGTVWNQPSDAPTADPAVAERVASNALVVLARPGGPPAPRLPPRPGTGPASAAPSGSGGVGAPGPTQPGQGGSAPVLGPPAPGTAPVSGATPLPGAGPLLSATPVDPGAPQTPAVDGLFSEPGAMAPLSMVPGLWTGASSSGSRVLGLVGAGLGSGLAGIENAGAGGGADVAARGSGASASDAGGQHRSAGRGSGAGTLGPLLDLIRDGSVSTSAMPRPPGRLAGSVILLQWGMFGVVWGWRRRRRCGLPLAGLRRRRPARSPAPVALPGPSRWSTVRNAMAGTWTL